MLERFRSGRRPGGHGAVALADQEDVQPRIGTAPGNGHARLDTTVTRGRTLTSERDLKAVRDRQRADFGGLDWLACLFGFLCAAGLTAILGGIVTGAGAATGLTDVDAAETIGIAGGLALLCVLLVAYLCGGYVAGRMSRFDGARQGVGVWLVGLLVALAVAAAAALFGSEYDVLDELSLPRIPVDQGTLTTEGIVALAIFLVVTLVAAIAGGKAGERYHRKVDRLALDA